MTVLRAEPLGERLDGGEPELTSAFGYNLHKAADVGRFLVSSATPGPRLGREKAPG